MKETMELTNRFQIRLIRQQKKDFNVTEMKIVDNIMQVKITLWLWRNDELRVHGWLRISMSIEAKKAAAPGFWGVIKALTSRWKRPEIRVMAEDIT